MALQKVIINETKYIPVSPGCCQEVYLCLIDSCTQYTLDGRGLVKATIQNTGRKLGLPRHPEKYMYPGGRCADMYQYEVLYDDAQMALDLAGFPIILTCECIAEINPYVCTTDKIISGEADFDMLCLTPLDEFPGEAADYDGCMVYVSGDGLYMSNGTSWLPIISTAVQVI